MAIRLEIDNIEIDLYEGVENELAQTFQVQNINGTSVVSSSFSTTIQVPLTSDNRSVFDFELSSNDGSNYQFRRATLLINGTPVLNRLNGGSCVVEEVFNDSISITLYSNNFALFSVISELTTGDLSIDLSHDVYYDNIVTLYGNNYTNGFTYAINTNNVDNIFDGNNSTRAIYAYPFFFLRYFFEKVFEEQGFTVSGNFLSDPDFNKILFTTDNEEKHARGVGLVNVPPNFLVGSVPPSNNNVTRQLGIDVFGDINGLKTGTVNTSLGIPVDPNKVTSNSFLGEDGVKTTIRFTCSLSIAYSPSPPVFNQIVEVRLHSTKKGVLASQSLSSSIVDVDISSNITLEDNEAFFVTYAALNTPTGAFSIITITEQERFDLGYYDYEEYKPNFNQLDLVKYVMNRYDLIATINYRTNDVKFTKFDDLKTQIVDWSNKIDFSKGYIYDPHSESLGKNNELNYANKNEDYQGVLIVNDNTLSSNNEYYNSIFSAENNRKAFGVNSSSSLETTNVKIIEPSIESIENTEIKINSDGDIEFQTGVNLSVKQSDVIRILNTTDYNYDYIVDEDTNLNGGVIIPIKNTPPLVTDQGFQEGDITIERIRSNNNSPKNLPVISILGDPQNGTVLTDFITPTFFNNLNTAVTDNRLSFQSNVDDNYTLRNKAYDKYKLLKAYFKLSLVDIQQLDFSKSVYINATDLNGRQINGYFYLNKVEQYKNDESTRCELLKL